MNVQVHLHVLTSVHVRVLKQVRVCVQFRYALVHP